MKRLLILLGVVATISLIVNGVLAYRLLHPKVPTTSAISSDGTIVLRTPGGLLEVSTIRAEERFDSTVQHTILNVPVGRTVAQIRVPAVYRYHVPLAKEWTVRTTDSAVIAIAPAVQPSVPVAIDTTKLEAFSEGIWSPITGAAALASLQKSITPHLNDKASSPERLLLQREAARATVNEFVRKWIVEQRAWKSSRQPTILVFFEDEPLGKMAASFVVH